MTQETTPEQNRQMQAWAVQRDEILQEISSLETLKSGFETYVKNLSNSAKEIADRKKVIEGNIEELIKKEAELPVLINIDIAKLENRRTSLALKRDYLQSEIADLEKQKASLKTDVLFQLNTFEIVKGSVLSLEKVVGHVTEVSFNNEKVINSLMDSVKKNVEDILEKSDTIVDKANNVIKELPRMIIEAKRQVIEKPTIKKVE